MTPFLGRAGISTLPFRPLLEEAGVKGRVKIVRKLNFSLSLSREGKRVIIIRVERERAFLLSSKGNLFGDRS